MDRFKWLLDRKGSRFVLSPLVGYLARRQGKGITRVFYDDGIWIHQTLCGYFAYHRPFVRLDLSKFDELARTNFLWGYQPEPGDVVVDVGAGVGEEALTFSRAVGERGKVICIEAHPRTYRCLEKLVQYNLLSNVIAIHRAVAEPSCQIATIADGNEYLRNRSDAAAGIPVACTTIDAIHQQLGLGRVHFLKMNIEGGERFAIRGMLQTLHQTEAVCISCHDFLAETTGDGGLRTKATVQGFFQQNGFRLVQRQEASLPPYLRDQVWAYNEELLRQAAS
jgi:FkbM family methyltransferase